MKYLSGLLLLVSIHGFARTITFYVDDNGAHKKPYDTLAKAATNIQTVVDYIAIANRGRTSLVATSSSVRILVAPGIYGSMVSIRNEYISSARHHITIEALSGERPVIYTRGQKWDSTGTT